ncbi:beta-ketoacyl synthase N-terminal-like domain-containing protein [Maritimibacter sp. UBA3975]|uniref:beta-ketoacyl synthase N-terminal-like domain-containing protein n=1 Tax=Maritimibacter sp. UBA3975 TaxID=1946833 RepID=UPI000C09A4A4|nr:beta-ketoacyl synthase N-terminal-like domain-containing protein [Maritimibacter sp. UBA3975]MAM60225.1 beta-ketoacyl-ACP synthase II [Maritimibacter sp.]|tara:strand:- start:6524 stop:7621 length:1098 start_codon:yes stop_codon:yes gene_type:complete
MSRSVVITGVGLVSACGTTADGHLASIDGAPTKPDRDVFTPHSVFRAAPVDFAETISSKSDRRQMEPWQLLGVTAAGFALESAGLAERDTREHLYLNVAANGGAREVDVDMEVLADLHGTADPEGALVGALSRKLRPSFLLGQLSNMLAGNIAIVLGVGGGARTFMGDEMAGIEAVADAVARIASGQSERVLVGGVQDAERSDLFLSLALGGLLSEGEVPPVLDPARTGQTPGSIAAFLVLESGEAAQARKAEAIAQLSPVTSAFGPGAVPACVQGLPSGDVSAILSAVSGVQPETLQVSEALQQAWPDAHMIATSDLAGHGGEAAFPFAIALSALMVQTKRAERAVSVGVYSDGAATAMLEAAR